jgi:hypothetical protein
MESMEEAGRGKKKEKRRRKCLQMSWSRRRKRSP